MAEENDLDTSPHAGPPRRGFFSTPEGRVFIIGLVSLAAAITAFFLIRTFWPAWTQPVLKHAISHAFGGRGAGMFMGRTLGVSLPAAILISSVMDMLVVFNLFPLIVHSYKHLVEFRFFGRAMRAAMDAAQAQRRRVGKFGILGIMLFVWFPFAMTGPLIGSLIGFLLGMRVWVNMAVVMTGTIMAAVSWALAYERMTQLLRGLHSLAPLALVAVVLGLMVFFRIRGLGSEKHGGG